MEYILRWLAGIGAAFKRPPPVPSASDITPEARADSAAKKVAAAVCAANNGVEAAPFIAAPAAAIVTDARTSQAAQVAGVALAPPDPSEIQRRRELVRAMFNDFWEGRDDKPAAFADRFQQAEGYLNERLSACGEFWQLDAATRKLLGLPGPSKLLKR